MKRVSIRWLFVACMICLGSVCQAQNVLQIQTPSGIVPVTHEGLQAVMWMQTSAEYRILCKTMFNQAEQALGAALANKKWTACLEQANEYEQLPPAVILDIDETVLDNSPFQGEVAKKDAGFEPKLWTEWVKLQKCEGIPGAVDFINHAREKGVTVFFITNRDHSVEEATRNNLTRLGVETPESMVLTQNKKEARKGSDKSSRRSAVAASHRVLLLIGDDLSDFVSVAKDSPTKRMEVAEQYADRWGTRWFLLPNPVYGSWEGALYSYDYSLKRPEILKVKWDLLRGFKSPR